MTQGARTNEVLDLDQLLAERELTPVPVKLGGKNYMVRRDLTSAEVAEFYKLCNEGKDVDALAVLVANAPVMLNKALEKLPRQHMILVLQKMMEAAGLIPKGGNEGESKAS
jgi:hypothetical protein